MKQPWQPTMMDEIEKALAGNNGDSSSTDSGVSQRLFGKLLSWMTDKRSSDQVRLA
jgi:hypothetical protein